MNILHISTDDMGGAARATYTVHENFKKAGHNSKIIVLNKTINDSDVIRYPVGIVKKIYDKIAFHLESKRIDPDYYFFNKSEKISFVSPTRLLNLLPFKPDIIFIYWVSGFVNTKNIYELNAITNSPVFWYAPDMAPLTGGCHYAWDCEGYKNNCGNCPALYSNNSKDKSHKNLSRKRYYLQKTNITFLAGCSYIEQRAEQSFLFKKKPIKKIFLPVDHIVFKPYDKKTVRNLLGIPPDKFIMLIGSTNIGEKRKGFKYLSQALAVVTEDLNIEQKEKIFILIIGNDFNNNTDTIDFPKKHLGYLKDDISLALAYQAANIFICPSIEDAGPMMIYQAIMCGTPVVAFNMGIAPDCVETGKTGYLAKLKDIGDLAKGIKEIIFMEKISYDVMSNNCREAGLAKFHPEIFKEQLLNIIQCSKVQA